ncbi:MAG: transposase, partial [Campylobacterales bacterium]|nr:transposase [Campylobacterales bacterium]
RGCPKSWGSLYRETGKYDSIGDMKKQVYKPYHQNQPMLIPLNLEEMVPQEHLVRQIDEIIDQIDTSALDEQYKGGGTSAYHPVMLLKVVLYAYSQKIYSSRRIAKALRENIPMLWLSRMNQPDFRTVNRFRGEVLRETIEDLFVQMVEELLELGLVDFEQYFVDGTKIEANANKYSFVWKKSTENYKAKLQENVKKLLDEVDAVQEWEDGVYGDRDLNEVEGSKEIRSEDLQRIAEKLSEVLNKESDNKKVREVKKTRRRPYSPTGEL